MNVTCLKDKQCVFPPLDGARSPSPLKYKQTDTKTRSFVHRIFNSAGEGDGKSRKRRNIDHSVPDRIGKVGVQLRMACKPNQPFGPHKLWNFTDSQRPPPFLLLTQGSWPGWRCRTCCHGYGPSGCTRLCPIRCSSCSSRSSTPSPCGRRRIPPAGRRG